MVQLVFNFFLFLVLCFLLFLPIEGWLSHSWAYQTLVWYPPCRGVSPVLGTASPPGTTMCLRKSGPPQDGALENHQGSSESSPFRLAASTVRDSGSPLSIFPRGHHQFPSEYKRLPPSGENPKTHGAPAGQDSVPRGGSQGRARSALKSQESHPRLST